MTDIKHTQRLETILLQEQVPEAAETIECKHSSSRGDERYQQVITLVYTYMRVYIYIYIYIYAYIYI